MHLTIFSRKIVACHTRTIVNCRVTSQYTILWSNWTPFFIFCQLRVETDDIHTRENSLSCNTNTYQLFNQQNRGHFQLTFCWIRSGNMTNLINVLTNLFIYFIYLFFSSFEKCFFISMQTASLFNDHAQRVSEIPMP